MGSLVGSRVERKEDKRFLTGKGRYTADINIAQSNLCGLCKIPSRKSKN